MPFLTIILTASQIMLAANRVPELNIEPSCWAAAEAAVAPHRDADVCKRDELTARGKLNDEWGQFTPAQKTHCVSLTGLGGSPSYVELLTCLELAKARRIEARDFLPGGGTPSAKWIVRQIIKAFPWNEAPRYLIRGQDGIYNVTVRRRLA